MVEEEEEEGQRFHQSSQQLWLLTGETGQADLFGFLLEILKQEGGGKRRGRLCVCVFSLFPPWTSFCAHGLRA